MKSLCFTLAILFILNSYISKAQISSIDYLNTAATAVPFLLLVPDASYQATGSCGIAQTGLSNSIFTNTSALAFAEHGNSFQINNSVLNYSWFSGFDLVSASGSVKLDSSHLLTAGIRYITAPVNIYSAGGILTDKNLNEFAGTFGFADKLNSVFSAGINLNYIYSNAPTLYYPNGNKLLPSMAIAADISCTYNHEFQTFSKKSQVIAGLRLANLDNKIRYTNTETKDNLPAVIGGGISYKINFNNYHSILLVTELNKLLVPTPDTIDLDHSNIPDFREESAAQGWITSFYDAPGGIKEEINEITFAAGIEYTVFQQLSFRAGYYYQNPSKGGWHYISIGAGIEMFTCKLDMAYTMQSNRNFATGNNLVVSISKYFDKEK